jgi:hypothetical protein
VGRVARIEEFNGGHEEAFRARVERWGAAYALFARYETLLAPGAITASTRAPRPWAGCRF